MQTDYHTDTTEKTKTMVATFHESREDYYHQYVLCDIPRKEPSKPMATGTLCHSILLEGKTFEDSIAIYPDECLTSNGSLHPAKSKAFRIANAGRDCMKDWEAETLVDLAEAMTRNELRGLIAEATHREHIFKGNYEGVRIKCKPDFMEVLPDYVCVYDLKFVAVAKPKMFERTSRQIKYWMQDAHYSAVMRSKYELPVVFRFIAVETSKPYRVDWYSYDQRSREIATEKWASILMDLAECERTGKFSDSHTHDLTLSPWDVDANEEGEVVLEGFDDDE